METLLFTWYCFNSLSQEVSDLLNEPLIVKRNVFLVNLMRNNNIRRER